jgi:hypothetical protein
MMSMGHKYTLVMASVAKWALQADMSPELRLQFLGHLEKLTDRVCTPAVIAVVEPIDAKGLELYHEATKLGYGYQRPNLFDVLYQKFDVFAALNPSLQRAYDEACRPWSYRARNQEAAE